MFHYLSLSPRPNLLSAPLLARAGNAAAATQAAVAVDARVRRNGARKRTAVAASFARGAVDGVKQLREAVAAQRHL